MEVKPKRLSDPFVRIAVSLIIAAGLIVAAIIFANAMADRPMVGSFSGSLSQYASTSNDLMDIEVLRDYLSIYPVDNHEIIYYDDEGNATDDKGNLILSYDEQVAALRMELEQNITSGAWPGFPYVKVGDRLYFSKKAVDEWFYTQSKAQLNLE